MSKGFQFIKKKQETPVPNTQTINLSQSTVDSQSKKEKGFKFIKKNSNQKESKPDPQEIGHQFKPEDQPKPSIESLFTNDLLFDLNESNKEGTMSSQSMPMYSSTQNQQGQILNNNNDLFSNFGQEQHDVPVSNKILETSLNDKKGFTFIKKKKESEANVSQNTNDLNEVISPIIQPSINVLAGNKHLNINNQYNEDYESQFYQMDKSEASSISSRMNTITENKQNKKPSIKASSASSTPIIESYNDDQSSQSQSRYIESNAISQSAKDPPISYYKEPRAYQPSKSNLTDESVKLNFENQKKNLINSYMDFISNLHRIKLELKAKKDELISLRKQLEKLASDEQIAIEENDFEKADRIETAINGLNAKIAIINKEITNHTEEIISAREKELNLHIATTKETEQIKTNFSKLKIAMAEGIDSFTNNELSKHNSENLRLKKMKEKLHFLKSNLDIEQNYIKEEEDKIITVIKSQSSDIFDELENLNNDKEVLNKEIEDLKAQLELKENALESLNDNIQSKESEIEAIKSNFNHDFGKIDIKKKNYYENLKDYEDQEKTYNKKTIDYQNTNTEYNEKMNQMKNQIAFYDTQISTIQIDQQKENEIFQVKETLLKKEKGLIELINRISLQVSSSQDIMKKHNEDIHNLNVNIKCLESEISQIEVRIPALEEEKKTFVKSKNFKEAGRVSNELKSSMEKKTINMKKIADNRSIIIDYENNSNILLKKISSLTEERKAKENELSGIQYESLNSYLSTLVNYSNMGVSNEQLTQEIQFTKEEIKGLEKIDSIQLIKNNNLNEKIESNTSNGQNEITDHVAQIEEITEQLQETKTVNSPKQDLVNKQEIEQQIEQLNNELQTAINIEDYEAADRIQTQIDKLNDDMNQFDC